MGIMQSSGICPIQDWRTEGKGHRADLELFLSLGLVSEKSIAAAITVGRIEPLTRLLGVHIIHSWPAQGSHSSLFGHSALLN